MSLNNGKKNDAYYRIGLSDEKINSVYERCVNNMEEVKVNDVVLQRTKRESKVSGYIKYGVAIVTACAMIGTGLYGAKYYSSHSSTKTDVSKTTRIKNDFGGAPNIDLALFEDDSEVSDYNDYMNMKYNPKSSDCKSEYELIAGAWNQYNTDGALEKSTELCYDSNGKLKEGYEIKKIFLKGSDKVMEVVGKDFITISAEQTKKNSTKKRRILKSKLAKYKLANEEYFSYDHIYFIQGNTLVRITCDDKFSVCFDKMNNYDKIELVNGKIHVYLNTGEDISESAETITTRFYDSNIAKAHGVICLKNNREVVEKLYDVRYYVIYDKDSNMKNVSFIYRDENNVLWQIKNVNITLDDSNTVDLKKLEVEKDYKKEKIVSNVNQIDVKYDGYIYGPDKMVVLVDKGYEEYNKSDDIVLLYREEYMDNYYKKSMDYKEYLENN